jgi:ubiquinone/menaquinone biosynthesis C-methylase UbiE
LLMSVDPDQLPLVKDELDVLHEMVSLQAQRVIELGCGNARLARGLVQKFAACQYTGLEVDATQHAKNLAQPQANMTFIAAGAQSIPLADACFDLALMLKSLHHVPLDAMDEALVEVARVVKPGGLLYVSEPIYAGALNEIVRIYNDEGVVRQAAQEALDRALSQGTHWQAVGERRFAQPTHYTSFDEFAKRMLYPTFADHGITDDVVARVQQAFMPHCSAQGASFVRPMHVRLLRRVA